MQGYTRKKWRIVGLPGEKMQVCFIKGKRNKEKTNKIFFIFLEHYVDFCIDTEKYFSYNAHVKSFKFPYIFYLPSP